MLTATTPTPAKIALIYHSGFMGDGKKEWSVDVFDFDQVCAAASVDPKDAVAGSYDADVFSDIMSSQTVDARERVYSPSQEQSEAQAIAYAKKQGYQIFQDTF